LSTLNQNLQKLEELPAADRRRQPGRVGVEA
jgi:hypothetical protein